MSLAVLALVPDAFGGRGGIAQYNRDFLTALCEAGVASDDVITVIPRLAPDREVVPPGIWQMRPWRGRVAFALMALAIAVTRKVDVVFCGHLYHVSLAA